MAPVNFEGTPILSTPERKTISFERLSASSVAPLHSPARTPAGSSLLKKLAALRSGDSGYRTPVAPSRLRIVTTKNAYSTPVADTRGSINVNAEALSNISSSENANEQWESDVSPKSRQVQINIKMVALCNSAA